MQAVKKAQPGANGGNGANAVDVATDVWNNDGLPVRRFCDLSFLCIETKSVQKQRHDRLT